jgi:hypothetical protein
MLGIVKYIFVILYILVGVCAYLFVEFDRCTLMDCFFEQIKDPITDIHDPNYVGGIQYVFSPFRWCNLLAACL